MSTTPVALVEKFAIDETYLPVNDLLVCIQNGPAKPDRYELW